RGYMSELALLSETDLRAALRLTNEARELPRGSRAQREQVLRGLAALTSAQVGVWGEIDAAGRLFPVFDFGWSGDAERAVFAEYARGLPELPPDPAVPVLMRCTQGPVVAATRQELIADRAWYRSAHVQELRRAARVDSFLYVGW